MNRAVYGKTMGNLTNRKRQAMKINEKDFLKWTLKPNYTSHKIFENDLVVISKSKFTLTLNKRWTVYIKLEESIDVRVPLRLNSK